MAKIKEFYYGFWTGGKPFEGKWYDGHVSEWHGPLKPYGYFRRYYDSPGGITIGIMMLYGVLAAILFALLNHKPNLVEFSIAVLLAVTIEYLAISGFVKANYHPFSFCPQCQTGLWTADIFAGFKNRYFAGAFQRCPNCRFEREYKVRIDQPVRERILKMLSETIPPPNVQP